jgi:hypothetical protein
VSRPEFGHDADLNDPLARLRIAVTYSHPEWPYLVGFDQESAVRPTDREAAMLASYLEEYKVRWYGPDERYGYRHKLAQRPLDADGGANGVVFHKYGEGDWGYRRRSWTQGPMFVPPSPRGREYLRGQGTEVPGPLTLEQTMDLAHTIVDKIDTSWVKWKAEHPEAFGG